MLSILAENANRTTLELSEADGSDAGPCQLAVLFPLENMAAFSSPLTLHERVVLGGHRTTRRMLTQNVADVDDRHVGELGRRALGEVRKQSDEVVRSSVDVDVRPVLAVHLPPSE